jgi:hypothetical protein
MTISVPPEQESSHTDDQLPDPQTPTGSSNEPASPSPSTPPTPIPAGSPTDRDRYIGLLEETLRENNRIIQELQTRSTQPAAPVAPAPTAEDLKQQFYNDPVTTTRNIVEEALDRTIRPLNEFVRGLKIEGSPYDRTLSKFRADPRFAAAVDDPQVMSVVEQIMSKTELNDMNMQSAIVHAIGLKAMGMIPASAAPAAPSAPAPTPAPTPTPSTVLPPHMRPSAPPAPTSGSSGAPKTRQLTENERRLMREQGFKSEAEYLAWLELPAGDVASATFDKPKPKA